VYHSNSCLARVGSFLWEKASVCPSNSTCIHKTGSNHVRTGQSPQSDAGQHLLPASELSEWEVSTASFSVGLRASHWRPVSSSMAEAAMMITSVRDSAELASSPTACTAERVTSQKLWQRAQSGVTRTILGVQLMEQEYI